MTVTADHAYLVVEHLATLTWSIVRVARPAPSVLSR